MKTFSYLALASLLTIASSLLSPLASAEPSAENSPSKKVFKAQSDWHWNQDFGSVDTEGARLDAIEQAYRLCVAAGNSLCELQNTEQASSDWESDGLRHLRYNALVEAIDSLHLVKGATFTQDASVNNSSGVESLTNMSAKATSLDRAMQDCFSSGADHCVILGLDFTEVNQYHSDGKYYTTAEASVRGYSEQ